MNVPRLKLLRLKIHRFRNVVPGCELHFDEGVNVVLGKNATGKTTLLGLICCAFGAEFGGFPEEPLEYECDLGPEPLFRVSVKRDRDASLEGLPSPTRLRTEVSVHWTNVDVPHAIEWNENGLTLRIGEAVPAHFKGLDLQPSLWSAFHVLGSLSPPALREKLKTWGAPLVGLLRFDESLETFKAMLGEEPARGLMVGAPPAKALVVGSPPSPVFSAPGLKLFVPSGILRDAHYSAGRLECDLSDVAPGGPEVCDLLDWTGLLEFARIRWIADLPVGMGGEADISAFTRFAFQFERRDGSTLSHMSLSYGQKRMLSLLYYMAASPHVLVADEFVNGLHHDWIEAVMSRIRDRQAFFTSQNPLLFDYLQVASPEQAARMFILCEAEEDATTGKTRLIWRNMTPDEARAFHEDLSAGVEYPSEVLLRRGLW